MKLKAQEKFLCFFGELDGKNISFIVRSIIFK